jgi:uncharacterized protein (TIGR03032 family)
VDKGEPAGGPEDAKLELLPSRQFPAWLAEQRLSLCFSTYQVGKLFLIGLQPDGRLSIFERTFNRAMGLWSDTESLYLATLFQLWRFDNVLEPGQKHDGYDRLYVPQMAWTTGDLDIHDLALDGSGRVVFVNTLFGCLATPSDSHSFAPLWKPPFISRLAAEDRCHLNGLAMRDGRAAWVTAVSRSDVADGWRDRRVDGGAVVDVATGEVIVEGLSMPHSPRWHDGRLWVLDSGSGHLCAVDPASGRVERVAFLPGYGRGLALHGHFAVVGLSKARENRTFSGLPLDDTLKTRDAEPRCGLWVVDLKTGDVVHWLRIDGVIGELYDVAVLPGVVRPAAIGLVTDEIRRMIRIAPPEPL